MTKYLSAIITTILLTTLLTTTVLYAEKEAPSNENATKSAKKGNSEEIDNITLDKILENYYNAIGGLESWSNLQTLKFTGTMRAMGTKIKADAVYKRPNQCRLDFRVKNIHMIESYDGTTPWTKNPLIGIPKPVELKGEQASKILKTCDFDGPLINYKDKGHELEYLGPKDVDDRVAYAIKVKFKDADTDTYFLDTETFLPIMVKGTTKINGVVSNVTTRVENYLETGDVVIPYHYEFEVSGSRGTEVLDIKSVQLNSEVDESIFQMPRNSKDSY